MSDKPESQKSPYFLAPVFETGMVTLACSNRRFWSRIGSEVDPECLSMEETKLALQTARLVAKENEGRGSESCMVVLQRIHQMVENGTVRLERAHGVAEMFENALDLGLPSEEAAVALMKPLLAKRLRNDAVRAAIDEYGKPDTDFSKTSELITKATRIGDAVTTTGIVFGSGAFEEIATLSLLERLPTGVPDLDLELDGGLRRGGLGIFVGGPNDGKSMGLSHVATMSMKQGLFCAYATLELTPADVLARIMAALTGVSINAILADPEIVRAGVMAMKLGPCVVQAFEPQISTMADIEEWVAAVEAQMGRTVDVLFTDYGDKLAAPKSAGKDADHGYSVGRVVFERMRLYAERRPQGKLWHWTASQATRKNDKKKKLDLNDIADSMHKGRVADLVVTLNLDEQDMMTFFVAKNRHGKARQTIGPLPTNFAEGQMVPMLGEP